VPHASDEFFSSGETLFDFFSALESCFAVYRWKKKINRSAISESTLMENDSGCCSSFGLCILIEGKAGGKRYLVRA
jgi:hypothetical protein